MTKKTSYFLIIILTLVIGKLTLSSHSAVAAEETNNSETTPTATEKLKERIEKIVEQRKDKVEAVLGDYSTQKRGYIGQVERVSETTFAFNVNDITRIVPFDEKVALLKNNKEIKAENVSVGDWAIVMGIWEDDAITPKKIFFSEKTLKPKTHVVELGSLKKINRNTFDFQSRTNENISSISFTSSTTFEDSNGEEVKLKQFTEEDQILVVGYQDENGLYATTVRALAPLSQN
ncbi:MAG: hypothetical protein COU63_03975 [Candidatus Pacebacteria bacterium CG10_big_fil_rev_8_21_14_0_10_36_11]|nr:hypothetical protein [Candidatus Pacearchaeota archaeon]OIP74055.1 MAG: hypothetical protein AUK08_02250 [Candidatus Pacebacteria bacterium CG2_30_36_39]PIR64422.1 MAG: hypothetical protein COU63_03975 [Candidatus Pacebacteria bacterium CG10_big_fil_rev_8_21_14_0_10_36_11]PJC43175.1 MAG: hypothetical protein CO040_00585 [Candidatus Pacebacteria bacterium CG_4_9_14_0_2_um_filter_36_8]